MTGSVSLGLLGGGLVFFIVRWTKSAVDSQRAGAAAAKILLDEMRLTLWELDVASDGASTYLAVFTRMKILEQMWYEHQRPLRGIGQANREVVRRAVTGSPSPQGLVWVTSRGGEAQAELDRTRARLGDAIAVLSVIDQRRVPNRGPSVFTRGPKRGS